MQSDLPVYTNAKFRMAASHLASLSLVMFACSLLLPAIDIGGFEEGDVWIVPGLFCLIFSWTNPVSAVSNAFLVLSTPLLMRPFNGCCWLRAMIVTGGTFYAVSLLSTTSRGVFAGYYLWLCALLYSSIAHWVTYAGNISDRGAARPVQQDFGKVRATTAIAMAVGWWTLTENVSYPVAHVLVVLIFVVFSTILGMRCKGRFVERSKSAIQFLAGGMLIAAYTGYVTYMTADPPADNSSSTLLHLLSRCVSLAAGLLLIPVVMAMQQHWTKLSGDTSFSDVNA